jgi:hypothetical protein
MRKDREAAINELLIKEEIRDIMLRYARGVNRLDGELVKACFHPDATEKHGAFQGSAQEFAAGLSENLHKGFQFTFHFLGNSLIEIEGNRAAHESYFVGWHRLYPDEKGDEYDVLFGGRYLAVNESRDGGPWLIAKRTVVNDWSRIDKVAGHWPNVDPFEKGIHTGENKDLVFHLLKGDPRI